MSQDRRQSNTYSPELTEFKECLDSTLRCRVWVLSGSVWIQKLDSMNFVGPSK